MLWSEELKVPSPLAGELNETFPPPLWGRARVGGQIELHPPSPGKGEGEDRGLAPKANPPFKEWIGF